MDDYNSRIMKANAIDSRCDKMAEEEHEQAYDCMICGGCNEVISKAYHLSGEFYIFICSKKCDELFRKRLSYQK